MHGNRWLTALAVSAAIVLGACGGGEREAEDEDDDDAAVPAATTTAPGTATPDAGGKVITVEMETTPEGNNIFEPADFEAKRGDVIRYVLVSGVHNAHFVADSNPGKTGLPAASPLLQLPGQTYEIKVEWEPGRYYYQCDPHALLGMIGHVTVTP